MSAPKLFLLSSIAMLAFALNSVLCRLALTTTTLDWASFTAIRLFSGALLLVLLPMGNKAVTRCAGSWRAAIALFIYAAAFSYAYLQLGAATGALLLFGAVQFSLILVGIVKKERLFPMQWFGLLISLTGGLILFLPSATSPAWLAALLMLLSGVSWAVYTLIGRQQGLPLAATKGNFIRTLPMALVLLLIMSEHLSWDNTGALYALLSGAFTSALGYAVWYRALPGHSAISAAVVQLSVPPLTALSGMLLLSETVSVFLVLVSVAILGGIGLYLFASQSNTV